METCLFFIYVEPEEPIYECPADITVTATSETGAIVNYEPPTLTSFCSTGDYEVATGLPSGSEFPIGTTTVQLRNILSGSAQYCGGYYEYCTFTVTVTDSIGGGCPGEISGFTTLGEFGNSKYFISDGTAQPTAAQLAAAANGGFLAVINDQAENDFIQQNISEMVYIGLNDAGTEGTLVWENGDPLIYNNVDPCSFCNENSDDLDYVIMAPWDGAWSFSSVWNSRKYIMEILCDGSTGGGDEPDLTVSNLTNLQSLGNEGEVVFFNFDLNNIGTITATGSYNINTYISTDDTFSSDDVLAGEVPTGDTPVGTIADVPAAITVPNLPDGNYFLIVVADALNEISESDENNNTISTNFEITTIAPVESCAYEDKVYDVESSGSSRRFAYRYDGDVLLLESQLKVFPSADNQFVFETFAIDEEGNEISKDSLVLPVDNKSKYGDFGYGLNEISPTKYEISAVNPDSSTQWTTIIDLISPDADIDDLVRFKIDEMEDHIIVSGFYHFGMTALWRPFLIKVDLNGNEVWQSLLDPVTFFPIMQVYEEAIGGGYYLKLENTDVRSADLVKVNEVGEEQWAANMAGDLVSNRIEYGGQTPDGSAVHFGIHSFGNARADITKLNADDGSEIWFKQLASEFGGDIGREIGGIVPTDDGGLVVRALLFSSFDGNLHKGGRLDMNGNMFGVLICLQEWSFIMLNL